MKVSLSDKKTKWILILVLLCFIYQCKIFNGFCFVEKFSYLFGKEANDGKD